MRLDRFVVRGYDVPILGRRRRVVIRGADGDQWQQRCDQDEVEEPPPEASARRSSRRSACHDAPIQGSLQSRFTTGGKVLAIPHNSNLSGGNMFRLSTLDGQPFTKAYAQTRSRWEPIVEVT